MNLKRQPKARPEKAKAWTKWRTPEKFKWWFLLGFLLWCVFGLILWVWNQRSIPQGHEQIYHFTTSFEAFHALVDCLALICLLFTVWQQQRELDHLQQEQQMQREAFDRLSFQNNFFNYLSLFNQFVLSLSEGNREGRECTAEWKRILMGELKSRKEVGKQAKGNAFKAMFKPRQNHMLPYFQHLLNVLEIIDKEWPLGHEEKSSPDLEMKQYVEMIKAQLSPDETRLLEYYCCTGRGSRMGEVVERFGLLRGQKKEALAEETEEMDAEFNRST